ncbi:uncharacterized protein LOC5507934 isoform X2 [Nematostella vectensis]|nr:uncharacterized protein LOC5507934 isoform X2 [Nematostella vectensis]XP_048588721.1 uncharacterized protein LOC5507934 isoform X2 [Nematostella vectensis]
MKFASLNNNNHEPSYSMRNLSVANMSQIGFRLSATVSKNVEKYYVTIFFDRGKITSVHCSCKSQTSWCSHVTKVALERICHPEKATISALPISDSLHQLDREQLLKLTNSLLNHHTNTDVVDTAQNLLEQLLNKNGQHGQADINVMEGVPDATSGPGLDEDSCWFLCRVNFRGRCSDAFRHNFPKELGFPSKIPSIPLNNRISQPVILEMMGAEMDKPFHVWMEYPKVEIVTEMYELLSNDSNTDALSILTESLIRRLETVVQGKSSNSTLDQPTGKLSMGFTPRVFSCGTLSDELARLWQLAVLNPKLLKRQKHSLMKKLEKLNGDVLRVCEDKQLLPWKGIEVALNMAQNVDLSRDELAGLAKGETPLATVSAVKLVQFILQGDGPSSSTPIDISTIHKILRPHSIRIGSIDFDIQTWCSIIQAFQFHNCKTAAINLAFSISAALVSFFLGQIYDNNICEIPTTVCVINGQGDPESAKSGKEPTGNKGHSHGPFIYPQDTLVDVSTFAFLYDALSVDEGLTESAFVHHQKLLLESPGHEDDAIRRLQTGQHIRDLVGLMGLFVPRIPMEPKYLEVEQFDTDNWLSVQMMSSPLDVDWEIVAEIAKFFLKHTTSWHLSPPSSLIRVIMYHCPPEQESEKLVFDAALSCLGVSSPTCVETKHWELVLFPLYVRLWAGLALLTMLRFGDSPDAQRMLDTILYRYGYLGDGDTENAPRESSTGGRLKERTIHDIKVKVSFLLAKAFRDRMCQGTIMVQCDTSRVSYIARCAKASRDREIFLCYTSRDNQAYEQALHRIAIKLGVYAYKLTAYDFSTTFPSWLTKYALKQGEEGFSYLLSCLGDDVSRVLKATDAFEMCNDALELTLHKELKITLSTNNEPCETLKNQNEGIIGVVNGVLKAFIDNALQKSDWSDLTETIRPYRRQRHVIPLWSQHLRAVAADQPVPSNILLSASSATVEYFKQWLCYRKEAEEGSRDACPPMLDLAFSLGIMGLEALVNERRLDVKEMSNVAEIDCMCDLVCYIADKKWSKEVESSERQEDGASAVRRATASAIWKTSDRVEKTYLSPFVQVLTQAVRNPMYLNHYLHKMCSCLYSDGKTCSSAQSMDQSVYFAVGYHPSLSRLLDETIEAINKLLLGPKTSELVNEASGRRAQYTGRRLLNKQFDMFRRRWKNLRLDKSYLSDILVAAKALHTVRDPSGGTFYHLKNSLMVHEPAFQAYLQSGVWEKKPGY